MNDVANTSSAPSAVPAEKQASLRQLTLICYILYALSWFTGITGIVAIIINYLKRDETAGTIYESHFNWQIRTFWWGLLWAVIGFITMFIVVGFVVLLGAAIWSIYRLVKGFLNWNDNKPMPT
jgi:uncharacterized membrane protein